MQTRGSQHNEMKDSLVFSDSTIDQSHYYDPNYIKPLERRSGWTSTQKLLLLFLVAAVIMFVMIIATAIIILMILFFYKSTPTQTVPPLILISIDGFRHDYLEIHDPNGATDISQSIVPNLRKLIQSGVRAKRMIPIFPSKTFPNHYTLVTGLYAESHGIVSNNMWDPEFNATFTLGSEESLKARWWTEGEAFWKTVEKQNLKAGCVFWPGSDAPGNQPTYWYKYDGATPYNTRVDRLFGMMDQPIENRPLFMTTYFEEVDHAGHEFGPRSNEVKEAMKVVDDAIGYLIRGLESRRMFDQTNILIVSDHGMSEIDPSRRIDVDTFLSDPQQFYIVNTGTFVDYWSSNSTAVDVAFSELNSKPSTQQMQLMQTLRKESIPEEWHWKNHRRISSIISVATNPTYSLRISTKPWWGRGDHGYLNTLEEMGAIFFARGPSFKQGYFKQEPFSNVNVYPLMASLLQIVPSANNGSIQVLQDVLK